MELITLLSVGLLILSPVTIFGFVAAIYALKHDIAKETILGIFSACFAAIFASGWFALLFSHPITTICISAILFVLVLFGMSLYGSLQQDMDTKTTETTE